jgi:Flp pilus assembly protein TadG
VRNFASTKKRRHESGYGLVFAAFGLIVLLGAAGMSVDFGYLRYQRRLIQSAADSAALAGAAVLGTGGGAGQAVIAAQNDSQINGFQDGQPTASGIGTISVDATPTAINGNANTMQVVVTDVYPTFFMRIFGASMRNVTVSTAATAQYLGGRGCIYALSGGGGINVTAAVNVRNCNVISNQNITGGGSITAASIGAHGRSSIAATPPAITGTLQVSDPLSYLPAQGTGGCTVTIDYDWTQNGNGPRTLNPGKYCSITFEGPKNGHPAFNQNVTFTPGTYVITQAGGLTFNGSGQVAGNGVTFYVGNGAVNFSNTQQIKLKAPNNAPYAGVLLFQPTGNNSTATINGSGGSYLQGALYFPGATLTLNGAANNTTNSQYLLLVAKTLNLHTNVTTNSNYASLPSSYSPIRTTALIE